VKTLLTVCRWVAVIGFLNVTSFIVLALLLGGDGIAGGTSGGHYYLSEHGHRTEVSHGTWIYSRVHAYSAMVSAPAAVIAGVIGSRLKKKHPALVPEMPD
jgi:hypothetical protein